jgi:hypothetical protein
MNAIPIIVNQINFVLIGAGGGSSSAGGSIG